MPLIVTRTAKTAMHFLFLWHLGTFTRSKARLRAFDSGWAVWEIPAESVAYSDQKLETEHLPSGLRFAKSLNDSILRGQLGSFPALPSDRHLSFLWAAKFPGSQRVKSNCKNSLQLEALEIWLITLVTVSARPARDPREREVRGDSVWRGVGAAGTAPFRVVNVCSALTLVCSGLGSVPGTLHTSSFMSPDSAEGQGWSASPHA